MYTIYADGELLYTPILSDEGYGVISPMITKEVNKSGSLEFTMADNHPFYDKLEKLKTIITVKIDGKEVFCGRVMSAETDFYKRRKIYCEGELAYLNDSVVRPFSFKGNASELFKKYIGWHNTQVGTNARFTVGTVDVSGTVDVEYDTYCDTTFKALQLMIESFGGYISIRKSNGKRYIDYKKNVEKFSGQQIEFGTNMLDLKEYITAENIYTVIIPVGAKKDDGSGYLTVKDVNNGLDYIQDDSAVELFGKIWKTCEFSDIKDASKLLKKGNEELSKCISQAVTITINAVDLHHVNVDTELFDIGCLVRVKSYPHGIDEDFLCSQIKIRLDSLDDSTYTFGNPKQTVSGEMSNTKQKSESTDKETRSNRSTMKNTTRKVDDHGTKLEQNDWHIKLLAWYNKKTGNMTQNNQSSLELTHEQIKAQVESINIDNEGNIIDSMKSSITQTAGSIVSKVEKNGVISAIEQSSEQITISASKINLNGYVTASQLSATNASISNLVNGTTVANKIVASELKGTKINDRTTYWAYMKDANGTSRWVLCGQANT